MRASLFLASDVHLRQIQWKLAAPAARAYATKRKPPPSRAFLRVSESALGGTQGSPYPYSSSSVDSDIFDDDVRDTSSGHNFHEPTSELTELSTFLLDSSLAPLASSGPLRATLFARDTASFSTGRLVLKRLLAWGPAAAESSGRASAERDGGVVELMGMVEEQLVREKSLVLPGNLSLVLPLTYDEGGVLLGILVVERSSPPRIGPSPSPSSAAAGASVPLPNPALAPQFSASELRALEKLGRALSLAQCLDQRAALVWRGSTEQKRAVRGLVREAQGNLSTLRTLSMILGPRAKDPADRDLTRAVLAQGDRLHELVKQLEQAIYPEAPLPSFVRPSGSLSDRASSSSGIATLSLPSPRQVQPFPRPAIPAPLTPAAALLSASVSLALSSPPDPAAAAPDQGPDGRASAALIAGAGPRPGPLPSAPAPKASGSGQGMGGELASASFEMAMPPPRGAYQAQAGSDKSDKSDKAGGPGSGAAQAAQEEATLHIDSPDWDSEPADAFLRGPWPTL